MFIELTDILRCPEPHQEQFVVLIPDEMRDRSVWKGRLGCPVCHREYPIEDGIVNFVPDIMHPASPAESNADAEALATFLGLSGPGGYVGLVNGGPALGRGLIAAVPGVHFVSINPAAPTTELPMLSLARAASIPVKSRALRGVVLLGNSGNDRSWLDETVRVVLPGLRIVGEGIPPEHSGLALLASAGGWWVGQRT
jgi:uncharacterized protein YbaR (Trm112 family)